MAIYRGTGGSAEATNNATVNEVASYATDAETSATNAASSATSAASSATSASSSATASASSATASESSATASATSASASATSATNASTSASQAASSASAASTSASNASTSETNAASSETAAASSASNAATSATNANTSASNASTSETNAATSASNASTSETNAATSASEAAASAASIVSDELESAANAAAAAQSYDNFDDRYLGAKASDPTVDNDGDALITGAMYFDSSNNVMKVYSGTEWQNASSSIEGIKSDFVFTATASQVLFSGSDDNTNTLVIDKAGLVNVYLNGVRLTDADYTIDAAANSVTLDSGATVGDIVEIEVFGNFAGQSGADVAITGGVIDGVAIGSNTASTGEFTTVTTTGSIGVGVSSPSEKLSIDGDIWQGNGGGVEIGKISNAAGWYDLGGSSNVNGTQMSHSNTLRFNTNATERARIDSSGNLLVGKTTTNLGTAGTTLWNDGRVYASRTSGSPIVAERLSTDGAIASFFKDGSTVGSIASDSGNILQLNSGGNDKGVFLARNGANVVGFAPNEDNVFRPATVDTCDLGKSDRRFKDLYLSGGVYLGGTGAANKLDDYEEGTFTSGLKSVGGTVQPSYTISTNRCNYVKIGRVVIANVDFNVSVSSNGTDAGLLGVIMPFNAGGVIAAGATSYSGLSGARDNTFVTVGDASLSGYVDNVSNYVILRETGTGSGSDIPIRCSQLVLGGTKRVCFTVIYNVI